MTSLRSILALPSAGHARRAVAAAAALATAGALSLLAPSVAYADPAVTLGSAGVVVPPTNGNLLYLTGTYQCDGGGSGTLTVVPSEVLAPGGPSATGTASTAATCDGTVQNYSVEVKAATETWIPGSATVTATLLDATGREVALLPATDITVTALPTCPPAGCNSTIETFTSPGTYAFTVPPGVSTLNVRIVGAGGGGGGGGGDQSDSGNEAAGGNGGRGGAAAQAACALSVTPGVILIVDIGKGGGGGAGGAGSGSLGIDGGPGLAGAGGGITSITGASGNGAVLAQAAPGEGGSGGSGGKLQTTPVGGAGGTGGDVAASQCQGASASLSPGAGGDAGGQVSPPPPGSCVYTSGRGGDGGFRGIRTGITGNDGSNGCVVLNY